LPPSAGGARRDRPSVSYRSSRAKGPKGAKKSSKRCRLWTMQRNMTSEKREKLLNHNPQKLVIRYRKGKLVNHNSLMIVIISYSYLNNVFNKVF